MSKTKKKYIYAVGRRKEASAQIRLFKGKGKSIVNNIPLEKYFPGRVLKVLYEKPFRITNSLTKFHFIALVKGSGKIAQLGAIVHGLARALDKHDAKAYHESLKKNDLLTRDSRTRERRKVGQMGRARKKKQSPKR